MPTFGSLKGEYARLWDGMTITRNRIAALDDAAAKLISNRKRYVAVAAATGVPWWWIAAVHWREASGSFGGVLHNGENIIGKGTKTKLVPKSRGPFKTWEEAAIDALRLKSLHKIDAWTVDRVFYEAERYNGWGYRGKGVPSAYVWSFTNVYKGGKYVADHVWSATAMDAQPGVAPLLKRMMERDPTIKFDAETSAAPVAKPAFGPGTYNSPGLKAVQDLLRAKGYASVGMPDGDWGTKTETALAEFQSANGLEVTRSYDAATAAALPAAPVRVVEGPRATVTAGDLAKAGSVEVKAAQTTGRLSMLVGAPAAVGAAVQGTASFLGDAAGYIQHAKDFVGTIPPGVWLAALAGLAFFMWWNSRKATAAKVEAVRSGEDAGPVALAGVIAQRAVPA